jgi:hypothetical protein
MPQQWKESITVPIYKRVIKFTVVITDTYKTLFNILLSRLTPYANESIGIISEGFNTRDQLLIRHFAFIRYWIRYWSPVRQ